MQIKGYLSWFYYKKVTLNNYQNVTDIVNTSQQTNYLPKQQGNRIHEILNITYKITKI